MKHYIHRKQVSRRRLKRSYQGLTRDFRRFIRATNDARRGMEELAITASGIIGPFRYALGRDLTRDEQFGHSEQT